MKRKKSKKVLISFLLSFLILLPFPVKAAEPKVKEKTFTTESKLNTDTIKKEAGFEEKIKEKGKTYTLNGITYEVIDTIYLDKKEKVLNSTVSTTENYLPDETIQEDNLVFKLKHVELLEQQKEVSVYDEYDYKVTTSDLPETKSVKVTNDITGEQEDVICTLSSIEQSGTKTVSNKMWITFEGYDSDYYIWNGHQIPKNDSVPALAGYEDEMLSLSGAKSGSKITSIYWDGGTFINENGYLCRNAAANVESVIPMYKAYYTGGNTKTYACTYEADDLDGRVQYEIKVSAEYQQVGLSVTQYVLIGIFVLIIVIVIILFILSKKKKENEKNDSHTRINELSKTEK